MSETKHTLAAEVERLRATVRELREAARRTDLNCLCDVLNPCWNNRPTDAPGRHWGGGEACGPCAIRAALARADEEGTPCYHCHLTHDPSECGRGECDAVWVDPEGNTDGVVRRVCRECLEAGDPSGPGYRAEEVVK